MFVIPFCHFLLVTLIFTRFILDNLAVPLYVIEWNQILALAQSNGIVSLETPPSTAGHLHPEGLPELLAAVDRFSGDLRRAIVTAFFEARGTPVMYRMEGQPKSPSTEPVVKPDGTIVHPDVEPEERWYAVTRGRNVGVVQGE